MDLNNKVVLITGSSSGIGKTSAIKFAQEGAKVVINYKTNLKGALEVVAEIKKLGKQAVTFSADVADPLQVKKLFSQTLKTFGTVDILINNAGLAKPKPFLELTRKELIEEFDKNFFSFIYCSQEAARIMLKNGGVKS